MIEKKNKIVFVGLSGGVDSAVSAALLQRQGFDVVGVFIKTWHPDFLPCNEEEERRDAMRIAAHLDIPFLTFDLEDVYKKSVADYMIAEYRAGRTPNPDVMCNREVKFGAFLKKALAMGADYVATGHYARNVEGELLKSKDPAKDQSYFLWTLTQKQLERILFPIGHLKKTEVRALAKKFRLPVAEKKDSQGICFLGEVDLKEFLKHYIKPKKGEVRNEKGEKIGFHDGAVLFTLGERRGFTITKKTPNDKPYYIVSKDVKKNILYVSQDKNATVSDHATSYSIILTNCRIANTSWVARVPEEGREYTAQVRYHGELLPCTVRLLSKPGLDKDKSAEITFKKPVLVASGQSVVIYDGDILLGGGVKE